MPPPVRVAVVNDYEVVVAGIASILARYPERIEVVELDSNASVVSDVDVVLYDSFGAPQGALLSLDEVVRGQRARVVIFSWNLQPELVQRSFQEGAAGYVSKAVTGEELVDLLVRVHAGERVEPRREEAVAGDFGAWPGRDHGLSPREAEVLALICQGMSNQDIAERAFLGLNTVKTYIRSLYQKIDVDSRTRAVLWGIDHGFRPDTVRHVRAPR